MDESSPDSEVLKDNPKSFKDLQTIINQATSGTEIELTNDYAFDSSVDTTKTGISISKKITIIGNNHTIDGKKLSRIFQISGSNVVLKNLNLINGYTLDYGGAIKWTGSNGNLLNSTLTDNSASIGGAIYWGGSNGLIENNTIKNNDAISAAGAIYALSDVVSNNNVFEDNSPADEKDVMKKSDLEIYKKSSALFEFDGLLFNQRCINRNKHAVTGHEFVMSNMSIVVNNIDGSNVADYLKIAFVYNLNYSNVVWDFTDSEYWQSSNAKIKKIIELYDQGVRIPDTYKRKIDENTYEMYTFKAVYSLDTSVQNLFLYNLTRQSIIKNLTVEKISLDPSVIVGDKTRFLINLTNTGNFELDNPYVIEYDFEGLTFDSYIDESGNWDYDGNNQWTFHGTLAEQESSHFIVVFTANKVGNFTNYIVAGVNDENISYANNTTCVNDTVDTNDTTDENSTEEDTSIDNSTKDDTEKVSSDDFKVLKECSVKKNVTGNPLILLLFSLISLILIPINRKIK